MFKQAVFGLSASVAIVASAVAGDEVGTLMVGEKAPRLGKVTWLKGDPVSEWQSGQVYVLDFWATWCVPCVAAIPHVNELQGEFKDKGVNVIGLAIWPRDKMVPTTEFVQNKGDEMAYRIAEDIDGEVAKRFMDASGEEGIPTIMIIDRAGTLVWIGHPTVPEGEFDLALKQVVEGTYDIGPARSKAEAKLAKEKQVKRIKQDIEQAKAAQNWHSVIAGLDELIELDPVEFGGAIIYRYQITLQKLQDRSAAAEFGRDAIRSTIVGDSPFLLNQLAWGIVYQFGLEKEQQDLELAMLAAEKADQLTESKIPALIDTLARVHFVKGETDKAVELQKQAIDLAEEGEQKESFKQTLTEYENAKRRT